MPKQAISKALERLECVSAEFLEGEIAAVEKGQGVHVKDVDVVLVPGAKDESPTVDVVVTI